MEFNNLLTLIEAVSESKLTGLKYEEDGVKLHLTKSEGKVKVVNAPSFPMETASPINAAEPAVVSALSMEEAKKAEVSGKIVNSPLVGTFYVGASEDVAPFVSVGDSVKKGQTLAIVEAMKLMNEIESEFDGTVAEILVENGQAVEYGQPLFRIS